VSRRHARILRNNGEVQIEDLGSYNGIRVNNARIAERVALRVSDQVQIGDYKLYLKAEGVEQVDDARTMPIERVGAAGTGAGEGTPTDIMPAVAPAPTQPMGIPTTPPPGTLPSGAQLVGNPNRTLVAVADTDPQGRPLANPAVVAALAAPAGYGRMVVLSSNFAGKEFELSRPQMIIGRTDENDMVVNHRSISRNHAKIVREPETGRYTISDLQSSNGVRVNGQDYGKVELRRGDVIDLGHVRLRFVEPGEDFIFSRDAVITDVPESGGRRGLMIAIFVSVVVLAGTIFFLLTHNKDSTDSKATGPGTGGAINGSDGSAVAVAPQADAAEPQGVAPAIDAPEKAAPTQTAGQKRVECKALYVDKKWQDAIDCAAQLEQLKDPEAAKIRADAVGESTAEATLRRLQEAANNDSLRQAKKELDSIPTGSVYRKEADKTYKDAEKSALSTLISRAQQAARRDKTCKGDYANVIEDAQKQGLEAQVKERVRCSVAVASGGNNTQVTQPPPPPPPPPPPTCNAAQLKASGEAKLQQGLDAAALVDFEASIKCHAEGDVYTKAFMAACRSRNEPKARSYYKALPTDKRDSISQICVRNGITF